MKDPPLDLGDNLAGIAFVPVAVEVLGDRPKLNNEIIRQVLRLYLASLLAPQPQQGLFVIPHDDAGVRAADERAAVWVRFCPQVRFMPSSTIRVAFDSARRVR